MTRAAQPSSTSLKKQLRAVQYFTMAAGSLIGVAWVAVIGAWLVNAGPLGTIIGMSVGGLAMLLVGACYAELATALPRAGGEIMYAYRVFGRRAAFFVGWTLSMVLAAVIAFEAIAVVWVLENLFPPLKTSALYNVLGEAVTAPMLVIGVAGTAAFATLNFTGLKSSSRLQDAMTWVLIASALTLVGAGLVFGNAENLSPLFAETPERTAAQGVLAVLIGAPFYYSGFQVVPQLVEEKLEGASLRTIGLLMLASLVVVLVFYCGITLSLSMLAPWGDWSSADLPAAEAMRLGFETPYMAIFLMLTGVLGILTTWNAVFIWATHLVFTMGRARMIPGAFGRMNASTGAAPYAILCVAAIGVTLTFLGRGAITPIVNAGSIALALAFVITTSATLILRFREPDLPRPFRTPGGAATIILALLVSLAIAAYAAYEPWTRPYQTMPIEWVLIIAWAVLGGVFAALSGRQANKQAAIDAFGIDASAAEGEKE